MELRIDTSQGWTEVSIGDTNEMQVFLTVAQSLNFIPGVTFTEKVNDLESTYWTFEYKGSSLFLSHNIWLGTTILPKALNHASAIDNQTVLEIRLLLIDKLSDG